MELSAHLWTVVNSDYRNNFVSNVIAFLASGIRVLTKLCFSWWYHRAPGCLDVSPLSLMHAAQLGELPWVPRTDFKIRTNFCSSSFGNIFDCPPCLWMGFPPFWASACSAFCVFCLSWEKCWIGVFRNRNHVAWGEISIPVKFYSFHHMQSECLIKNCSSVFKWH